MQQKVQIKKSRVSDVLVAIAVMNYDVAQEIHSFPFQNSPIVQFDTTPTQSPRHYYVTNHQRSFSPSTALYLIYSIFIYDYSRSVTFRYQACQQDLHLRDIVKSTRASGFVAPSRVPRSRRSQAIRYRSLSLVSWEEIKI